MSNKLFEIKFAESKDISKVQLLRAGTYDYYGEDMEITSDDLRNMKKNFTDNVKQVDLAIDYYHHSYSDAAGWIKEVVLEAKDSELWVVVDWTENGREKILSKELRYLSVDFDHNYKDNETGDKFGITLNGGGLTNRPFVKGMNPILHDKTPSIDKKDNKKDNNLNTNPKRNKIMDFAELKSGLVSIEMSDNEKSELVRLVGFQDNSVELSEKVKNLGAVVDAKNKEIVTLSERITKLDKEGEFSVMLSEGKACPAQKDAFMDGNMSEFVKLSVPVQMSASGDGKAPTDKKTDKDAYKEIITMAEKMEKDDGISLSEAIDKVRKANPILSAAL